MSETKDYVKRYYSCYPFLLQICILWLNHYKMAEGDERQKENCLSIEKLCRHIKANCNDMRIHGNAVLLQALVCFQIGRIQEVIDELEEFSVSNGFGDQSSVLLAQAYAMLGNMEKTNIFLSFEYQAAVCYLAHGKKQKAMEHIERYVMSLSNLFSSADLHLHGDAYFNRIEEWFDNGLDNGTNAPRNRKVVLEDAKKTLDVPPFTVLNGEPSFEKIKSRLMELS